MGSPPRIDCLKYVCDHLLVSDLNDVKYVAAASALETSVSVFEGDVQGECICDCCSSISPFSSSPPFPSSPHSFPSLSPPPPVYSFPLITFSSPPTFLSLSSTSSLPLLLFLPSLLPLPLFLPSIPSLSLSPPSFLPLSPLHLSFPLFISLCLPPSLLLPLFPSFPLLTSLSLPLSLCLYLGQRASTPQSIPSHAQSLASAGSTSDVSQPFSPGGSIAHTVMVLPNSMDEEAEEVITFDVQPGEGRLPDSSYTEEDSLFTWTDITGM